MAQERYHSCMSVLAVFSDMSSPICIRGTVWPQLRLSKRPEGKVNDYLIGDALRKGNRVVAGAPGVFDQLDTLLERGEG